MAGIFRLAALLAVVVACAVALPLSAAQITLLDDINADNGFQWPNSAGTECNCSAEFACNWAGWSCTETGLAFTMTSEFENIAPNEGPYLTHLSAGFFQIERQADTSPFWFDLTIENFDLPDTDFYVLDDSCNFMRRSAEKRIDRLGERRASPPRDPANGREQQQQQAHGRKRGLSRSTIHSLRLANMPNTEMLFPRCILGAMQHFENLPRLVGDIFFPDYLDSYTDIYNRYADSADLPQVLTNLPNVYGEITDQWFSNFAPSLFHVENVNITGSFPGEWSTTWTPLRGTMPALEFWSLPEMKGELPMEAWSSEPDMDSSLFSRMTSLSLRDMPWVTGELFPTSDPNPSAPATYFTFYEVVNLPLITGTYPSQGSNLMQTSVDRTLILDQLPLLSGTAPNKWFYSDSLETTTTVSITNSGMCGNLTSSITENVQSLTLSGLAMSGELPPFFDTTTIQWFDISNNFFKGIVPAGFAGPLCSSGALQLFPGNDELVCGQPLPSDEPWGQCLQRNPATCPDTSSLTPSPSPSAGSQVPSVSASLSASASPSPSLSASPTASPLPVAVSQSSSPTPSTSFSVTRTPRPLGTQPVQPSSSAIPSRATICSQATPLCANPLVSNCSDGVWFFTCDSSDTEQATGSVVMDVFINGDVTVRGRVVFIINFDFTRPISGSRKRQVTGGNTDIGLVTPTVYVNGTLTFTPGAVVQLTLVSIRNISTLAAVNNTVPLFVAEEIVDAELVAYQVDDQTGECSTIDATRVATGTSMNALFDVRQCSVASADDAKNSGGGDDDPIPWWAVLLIVLAALGLVLVAAVVVAIGAWQAKSRRSRRLSNVGGRS